ncbi:hypothetical protein R1T08_32080 [Streptomyces sp. SBC-4]|nr:hypothetical protein [Streptomyces sp. SBC-4]MDV5148677.1 hypothetical protein [Streptomyces sp. SBC-4]
MSLFEEEDGAGWVPLREDRLPGLEGDGGAEALQLAELALVF